MRAAFVAFAALGLAVLSARIVASAAAEALPVSDRVAGQQIIYTVTSGETLARIAARFGMKRDLAAAINQLRDPNRLHIGQRLLLSNRHIVPSTLRDGLVINTGDLRLYWLRDGAVVATFPVGVGRTAWRTPPGHYRISSRRRDPIWHVPPSIQREMREHGEPVKKTVPPGPDNPLGKYWLQLSAPGYGLHGTNAPWSVGKYTTHGCIRLRPDDIERLYNEVPNDTAVDIVDEPIKLAQLGETILLEAHAGAAEHPGASAAGFLERLKASEVADLIDLAAAQQVLRNGWGIAIDISKKTAVNPEPHAVPATGQVPGSRPPA